MSSRPPVPVQASPAEEAADPRLRPQFAAPPPAARTAASAPAPAAAAMAAPGVGGASAGVGKKEPFRSLTVPFDEETWTQLETTSATFGMPKSGTVRRCVRLAAWILDNLKDGYKLALIKKGESPRLVELI